MAINKLLLLACLATSTATWSREAASPSACQAAASQPAIVAAKSALDANPGALRENFDLADAWSDAGCFNDAVQVLQSAAVSHPADKELETRLRVAKSLVGEEHFFDNLDRANADAKLKRQAFRCNSLYDVDACNDALRLKPDDPALLIALGDSLMRAKRPADALNRYRLAAVVAPNQRDVAAKIASAESQLPAPSGAAVAATPRLAEASTRAPAPATLPAVAQNAAAPPIRIAAAAAPVPVRRYSNAAPEAQSH